MKILILSFKAGEGHNSAAKAILERVEHEGHEGEIVDFLGLFSDKISNAVNISYVGMVKHTPALFGTFYKFSAVASRMLPRVRSPLYLDSAIISKRLCAYLEKNGPYDGIVATHLMPAQALAHLKKHNYDLPVTVAVATDYTYYPFWQEVAACDYYVIPNEALIPTYVKHGMPKEKLCPYGIPISMKFLDLPTREMAREKLGFEQDTPLYLVMGGSMGAGSMRKFAKAFHARIPKHEHMVIICGKNDALRESLEKHFAGEENVHVVGFTTEVATYMVACDVLYTKPGGLSSSEALVCRIPLVHTAPIPGCESDNFAFFTAKGCSLGAKSIDRQIKCGIKLMGSEDLRRQMKIVQAKCAKPNSSLQIFQLIEKHQKKDGE